MASGDVSQFETTVPQQSLYLMNNPFVQAQARRLSAAVDASVSDPGGRIRERFRRILQREPEAAELERHLAVVAALEREPRQSGTRWQYGRGQWVEEGNGFAPLPWFGKDRWSGSEELPDKATGWTLLNRNGGHPGTEAAIRRWNAPEAGRVRVSGRVELAEKVSDGIRVAIRHSRLGVLWVQNVSGGGGVDAAVETEVGPGDAIDFVVDRGTTDNSDGFSWAPRITDATTGILLADAAADFGGPGLSAWEAFTQVLLCTNEFLFAD